MWRRDFLSLFALFVSGQEVAADHVVVVDPPCGLTAHEVMAWHNT